MNELIEVKISNENGVNVVSSRDIAKGLGKQHKDVLKALDVVVNSIGENVRLLNFIPSQYLDSRNRAKREYLLTKDGFTLYMFNIQGHNDFKVAYINKFNEMEKIILENRSSYMIENPIERAKKWIEEEQVRIEQARLIEEQTPKVEYHDKVLVPEGLITTTNIAKDLGMSANALNNLLYAKKIIYKSDNSWKPYSKYQWLIPDYADYHITEFGQTLKWTELGRKFIIDVVRNKRKK